MQIAGNGRLQETEPFGGTNVWVLGVLKRPCIVRLEPS
jgi:hypothetical protein